MKNSLLLTALTIGIATLVGCASESTQVEPGAVSETHKQEIPGTHDPADLDPITAQRWIDDVRIGHSVDSDGKITAAERSDTFRSDDKVYLSMKVTDASAGTEVLVSIVDASTDSELWSDTRTVQFGESRLVFEIDSSEFGPGGYRADVFVGDERVARRAFDVT